MSLILPQKIHNSSHEVKSIGILRDMYLLHRVGEEEAIQTDHGGGKHIGMFTDAHGGQVEVQHVLHGSGVELEPAGVPLGHGILVVAPQGPGCHQGAVDHGHDHGDAAAAGDTADLVHQGEAHGGGGGGGPHAGELGAYADAHGGVLGLHADILGVRSESVV